MQSLFSNSISHSSLILYYFLSLSRSLIPSYLTPPLVSIYIVYQSKWLQSIAATLLCMPFTALLYYPQLFFQNAKLQYFVFADFSPCISFSILIPPVVLAITSLKSLLSFWAQTLFPLSLSLHLYCIFSLRTPCMNDSPPLDVLKLFVNYLCQSLAISLPQI